jgi:hypothetical protein
MSGSNSVSEATGNFVVSEDRIGFSEAVGCNLPFPEPSARGEGEVNRECGELGSVVLALGSSLLVLEDFLSARSERSSGLVSGLVSGLANDSD